MKNSQFPTCPVEPGFSHVLFDLVAERYAIWGPVVGTDGISRIQPIKRHPELPTPKLTTIPVKKLLLPPREKVWVYADGRYQRDLPEAPIAVFGLALCDLQAVKYLDLVFAEDAHYRRRRDNTLLIGGLCRVQDGCRCRPEGMAPAGDLFMDEQRLWVLSDRGRAIVDDLGLMQSSVPAMLPWPVVTDDPQAVMTEEMFAASTKADIWRDEGRRCLSCGACSAVCPTCYCFDLVDCVDSFDRVTRLRTWDNCFFASHGAVAGGFDFRPDRTARLRFRMEHKRLGFGGLRGVDSCVGCGRCRNACPVDIDLDQIVNQLSGKGA